jgi:capsular polysaccharide biosynthesis protein
MLQGNGHRSQKPKFTPIHAAEVVSVTPLSNPNSGVSILEKITEFNAQPTFVARLANHQLVGKGIAIMTPDRRLLSEVTVHIGGTVSEHSVMKRFTLPPVKSIAGTTAVLSVPAGNTYYHWLFDLLPRLELIRLAGISLSDIDQFAVNSIIANFQKETLSILQIDESKILETDREQNLICEDMVLPSFPGTTMLPPKWVCDFLVKTFLKTPADNGSSYKRIYVTRRNSTKRRVINQLELDEVLVKNDFQLIDSAEYDVAIQARIFNQADIIVAPRGSGLSNLVFCKPDTIVVELFPPDEIQSCFRILSSQVGLNYHYRIGSKPDQKNNGSDFFVEVKEFATLLDRLL